MIASPLSEQASRMRSRWPPTDFATLTFRARRWWGKRMTNHSTPPASQIHSARILLIAPPPWRASSASTGVSCFALPSLLKADAARSPSWTRVRSGRGPKLIW